MESTIARTGGVQGAATSFCSDPDRGPERAPHASPAAPRGDFEVCSSAELKATLLAIFGGEDDADDDADGADWSELDGWHVGLTTYGQAVADASGPCDLMRKVWGSGGPINA